MPSTLHTYTPKAKKETKKPSPLYAYFRRQDKTLVLAVVACSVFSVLLLYSIYKNNISSIVGASYYQTQLGCAIAGVVLVVLLSIVDYHKIARLWFIYAPIALILTLLTFTALGVQVEGADDQAWLNLGFTQLQPSEILKLAFILTFALHLSYDEEKMNKPLHMLLLLLHGAVPTGIVALQGDFGTAIVFACIFLGMLLAARISWKYIVALIVLIPVVAWVVWEFFFDTMHKNRILILFHPGTDLDNLEYQQDMGLRAMANGGTFGKGLFAGEDEYVSVPEIHNDFIFAHVGQTLGFVGAIVVVLVLAFICLKILYNANRSKDKLGMLICVGVFAMLLIHCILNIGMVLKVAPVIGVPLPFLSAGGTATLSMYVAIGMVVSVYSHNGERQIVFEKR